MTDLQEKTCMMTATFAYRTNKAAKVEAGDSIYWIPFSQIHNVYDGTEEDEIDIISMDPRNIYVFRITAWIACKLFQCDGWEDLIDRNLSFLDCE